MLFCIDIFFLEFWEKIVLWHESFHVVIEDFVHNAQRYHSKQFTQELMVQ